MSKMKKAFQKGKKVLKDNITYNRMGNTLNENDFDNERQKKDIIVRKKHRGVGKAQYYGKRIWGLILRIETHQEKKAKNEKYCMENDLPFSWNDKYPRTTLTMLVLNLDQTIEDIISNKKEKILSATDSIDCVDSFLYFTNEHDRKSVKFPIVKVSSGGTYEVIDKLTEFGEDHIYDTIEEGNLLRFSMEEKGLVVCHNDIVIVDNLYLSKNPESKGNQRIPYSFKAKIINLLYTSEFYDREIFEKKLMILSKANIGRKLNPVYFEKRNTTKIQEHTSDEEEEDKKDSDVKMINSENITSEDMSKKGNIKEEKKQDDEKEEEEDEEPKKKKFNPFEDYFIIPSNDKFDQYPNVYEPMHSFQTSLSKVIPQGTEKDETKKMLSLDIDVAEAKDSNREEWRRIILCAFNLAYNKKKNTTNNSMEFFGISNRNDLNIMLSNVTEDPEKVSPFPPYFLIVFIQPTDNIEDLKTGEYTKSPEDGNVHTLEISHMLNLTVQLSYVDMFSWLKDSIGIPISAEDAMLSIFSKRNSNTFGKEERIDQKLKAATEQLEKIYKDPKETYGGKDEKIAENLINKRASINPKKIGDFFCLDTYNGDISKFFRDHKKGLCEFYLWAANPTCKTDSTISYLANDKANKRDKEYNDKKLQCEINLETFQKEKVDVEKSTSIVVDEEKKKKLDEIVQKISSLENEIENMKEPKLLQSPDDVDLNGLRSIILGTKVGVSSIKIYKEWKTFVYVLYTNVLKRKRDCSSHDSGNEEQTLKKARIK